MIETDARSTEQRLDLLDVVRRENTTTGEILEVITGPGSEFYVADRDQDGEANHPFEKYLDEHRIKQTVSAVSRPQSNDKIERVFQTYDKQHWRFDTLDEFLEFERTLISNYSFRM